MRTFWSTLAFLAVFDPVWLTPAAAAPSVCGDRTEILKSLASKYHEAPSASGLTSSGVLLEILQSKDGATWTAIVSSPDGQTCLVAAGENWTAVLEPGEPTDEPDGMTDPEPPAPSIGDPGMKL